MIAPPPKLSPLKEPLAPTDEVDIGASTSGNGHVTVDLTAEETPKIMGRIPRRAEGTGGAILPYVSPLATLGIPAGFLFQRTQEPLAAGGVPAGSAALGSPAGRELQSYVPDSWTIKSHIMYL